MADFRGIDINEYAENGLNDVSGLINRREYKRGIIKARQIAERLVKSYASEKNIEYTTFADTIEQLYALGLINMETRDAFHTIRLYGNKVVHEADDNSADAEQAFYLLRNEVQTYMSRRNVSIDRTPVRIERGQQSSYSVRGQRTTAQGGAYDNQDAGTRSMAGDGSTYAAENGYRRGDSAYRGGESYAEDGGRDEQMPTRRDRSEERQRRESGRSDRYERSGRNRAGSGRRNRNDYDREERGSIGIYDILKVLIPAVVVILIIIIIKSLIPSKPAVTETSALETSIEETTTQTETSAEETTAEETEPETQAQLSYKIKGDGVNVRYADNQARIYTQLSNGTAIGQVTPLEGSDFVQFTLDGVNVVVRKDLIEPVQ